ncbi:MAG TPA: amidase [Acidobacteriaceae bacterium]|nr:amidase [Acidobacteriaceae bacterium]
MTSANTPIHQLHTQLRNGSSTPRSVMEDSLYRANGNASHNTYLTIDAALALDEAAALAARYPDATLRPALFGVPISVKDCFDISGMVTSCGSRFYATHNLPASADSGIVQRLRQAGAILPGKTHLHQLAYGITGENRDYGDCVQPENAGLLTGGSSSGAAASVQEGSAMAAIGTDTGGSVRVPAALCGLAGYRTSHGIGPWDGGYHLAPSFDTLGILFRDLRDGPLLAEAIFHIQRIDASLPTARIGYVDTDFLHDATPEVLATYAAWKAALQNYGAVLSPIDTTAWADSLEIFAGIQAHEAAAIHRGNFAHFEESIAARLVWGESLSAKFVQALRRRHDVFRARLRSLFQQYDFLIAPCAPVHTLAVGADHSKTRPAILRYTTPISLAGLPIIALTSGAAGAHRGAGVQLIGAHNRDAQLLAYAAGLADSLLGNSDK